MQRIYTTADYELKRGRFLILCAVEGDRYTEVSADIVEGADEAYQMAVRLQDCGSHLNGGGYWIHDGFIIASAKSSRECAESLFAKTQEEAIQCLARFLADLNAY